MIRHLKTWYARRKVYAQTVKELSTLSSKELYDLGINRDMIPSIANEATYGVR